MNKTGKTVKSAFEAEKLLIEVFEMTTENYFIRIQNALGSDRHQVYRKQTWHEDLMIN